VRVSDQARRLPPDRERVRAAEAARATQPDLTMSSQLHGNPMHPAVTSSPSADPAAAPAIVKRAQAAGASGLLVALHTGSNTGYAIAPLERAFLRMAREVVGSDDRIHFAYPNLDRGRPDTLPPGFSNIASLDLRSSSPPDLEERGRAAGGNDERDQRCADH